MLLRLKGLGSADLGGRVGWLPKAERVKTLFLSDPGDLAHRPLGPEPPLSPASQLLVASQTATIHPNLLTLGGVGWFRRRSFTVP